MAFQYRSHITLILIMIICIWITHIQPQKCDFNLLCPQNHPYYTNVHKNSCFRLLTLLAHALRDGLAYTLGWVGLGLVGLGLVGLGTRSINSRTTTCPNRGWGDGGHVLMCISILYSFNIKCLEFFFLEDWSDQNVWIWKEITFCPS